MLARIETTIAHERAFIDDAAHELRSPIAVLRGELELAAAGRRRRRSPSPDGLASALEETDRLTRLTEDLLTLARPTPGSCRRATPPPSCSPPPGPSSAAFRTATT